MNTKKIDTDKKEEFIKQLEELIEFVKNNEFEECNVIVKCKKAEKEDKPKKKSDTEELTEEDCKRLLHAIFDEDDEDEDDDGEDEDDDEFECDGDCENCENYVPDDPEEVFEDLGKAIGCMVYYGLPLPFALVLKYNRSYSEKNANSKDS